jgi:hypothetical protein
MLSRPVSVKLQVSHEGPAELQAQDLARCMHVCTRISVCPSADRPRENPAKLKAQKLARGVAPCINAGVCPSDHLQVGRENPAELKAQKLARSVARGVVDRDLKPDLEEQRRINEVLQYPPNRCDRATPKLRRRDDALSQVEKMCHCVTESLPPPHVFLVCACRIKGLMPA